ncbi:MAG: glutathione binding-like protein [Gammaproteobacteria bacterium]|jgi:GST-like protein|nr:glutathione binding-like protein [Gammaproteobacteria bacterium]
MIDVHYWPTPNGKKLTIALEEMNVAYRVVDCEIGRGAQFEDDFLKISPNNRMPAIVDHAPADGGAAVAVFESGACLMYLAQKYGQFGGDDLRQKWEVNQWLMWQMANQGPKFGERGHFARLKDAQGDQSYALRRFDDEVHRLYGVMNNRLYDRRYLAGDHYSIADMACYPWVVGWEAQGIDIGEFKYFHRWLRELEQRPALQKGMAVGADKSQSYSDMSPEELNRIVALLYNQRARPAPETGGIEE